MKFTNHLIVFVALLIFHIDILAQTNIRVILKTDKEIEKVDALDLSQKEIYSYPYSDTTTFQFKKTNIDCYNIRYHKNGKIYREQIWLDPGDVTIKAHITGNQLIIDSVFNSPIYYKIKQFYTELSNLSKSGDSLKINTFLLKAFEDNISNPFSYMIGQNFVNRNQNSKLDLFTFRDLLNRQGDGFKWFLLYPVVVDRVRNLLSTDKLKLTDFTLLSKENKITKFDLTGADYYVLDFWFLGCAPCIREHREIKLNLQNLIKQNIQIIGVSIDSPKKYQLWEKYLKKNNYTWLNYIQDQNNKFTDQLGVHAYPAYVILNKEGEIIESYSSFSQILKKYGRQQL